MDLEGEESYEVWRATERAPAEERRPGFMAVVDTLLERVPDDPENDPLEALRMHYGYESGEAMAEVVAAIAGAPGPEAVEEMACPDCLDDIDAGEDVDPRYRVQYREVREEPRFRQDSDAHVTQFFVYKCSRHPERYVHIGSGGHV